MKFLSEQIILETQSRLVARYGGSHGLRDRGLLLSALDRVENRFHYEPDTSVARLAAALGWGLIKNHVFLDGNKRIGLAAVIVFLSVNGYAFQCPEEEVMHMVLRAAASEIGEDTWTLWLESVVAHDAR